MGMFEQAKGRAKEALGDLTNDPDLQREGEAQAERAADEREAEDVGADAATDD